MNLINLNEYIVTKISPALSSFMSLKLQILPAFRRGVAHFYSFIMWDTRAFFVKLVRNWNVPISSNFAIIWWNRDISISNLLHKKWSGVSHILILWNLSSIFFETKFSEIDFTFTHKFSQSSQFSFAESCWVYFCLKSLLKPIDFYGSKTPATKYSTSGAVFRKADILGYRFDRWH